MESKRAFRFMMLAIVFMLAIVASLAKPAAATDPYCKYLAYSPDGKYSVQLLDHSVEGDYPYFKYKVCGLTGCKPLSKIVFYLPDCIPCDKIYVYPEDCTFKYPPECKTDSYGRKILVVYPPVGAGQCAKFKIVINAKYLDGKCIKIGNIGFTTYPGPYTPYGYVCGPICVPCPPPPPPPSGCRAEPFLLWPPNHKYVPITIQGVPGGTLSGATVTVCSDEPENAQGSGNTQNDARIVGGQLQVRSERSGPGDGRVYVIRVTKGNFTCCAVVAVPHDQSAASIASVLAQATTAVNSCNTGSGCPAGFGNLLLQQTVP